MRAAVALSGEKVLSIYVRFPLASGSLHSSSWRSGLSGDITIRQSLFSITSSGEPKSSIPCSAQH